MSSRWWRWPELMLLLVVCAASVAALPADDGKFPRKVQIRHSRGAEDLVVSYHEVLGELAEPDLTPRLRVFGDGRVQVHYPAFMQRAGDYELHLEAKELEELLLNLTAKGLVAFDAEEVKRSKELVARKRRQQAARGGGLITAVMDAETTVVELNLLEYRGPETKGLTYTDVEQRISWYGLRFDAEQYPELEPLQGLAAAVEELRGLLERADLKRIE